MSEIFDPYHKWLAIPPSEQPPNFYRLLSLPLYETDQEVIAAAAVQRINWVRNFESGASGDVAKKIKDEISSAWLCLRNPDHKQQYDEQLRRHTASQQVEPPHTPPTLFATALPNPPPANPFVHEAGIRIPDSAEPRWNVLPRAKRSKSTTGAGLLVQASAGPIGLVLGYIILCQFGPQYDFLGIWNKAEPSKTPAAVVSSASNQPGWPNRKPALKPSKEKSHVSINAAPTNPNSTTPPPGTAPALGSAKLDFGPTEVATIVPVVVPAISSPSSPAAVPEKNDGEPTENFKEEQNRIFFNSSGELQQTIAKCRTAKDALRLLRETIANANAPEEVRSYASSQLSTWEERAANDSVRLGDVWMPRAAAKAAREKANDLIIQAAGLLSLDNEQPALVRLHEAARVDPEATSAVFLLGVHYALGLKNYQEAKVCFGNCLRRRPDDVGALNDLGLANLMLGKHSDGLKNFRAAVKVNPRSAEVAHNLRRIVKQDALKILVLPPSVKNAFVDLLTNVISDETVTALDNLGWLYVTPAAAPAVSGLPPEVPNVLPRFVQAKTNKTVKVHAQWIEDCQCLWCLGVGKVSCSNPDCTKGKISVITGRERTGAVDLITLQPQYRNKTELKDCPICNGKGRVDCEKCFGRGTDPTLSGIDVLHR